MSDFIIEVNNIVKRYGSKQVLENVNLQLPEGGVHAVVGSNGAGKSTLFRLLLGLVEPTSGHAKVFGCDSTTLNEDIRAKIAYVNEDHSLLEWMTVSELKAVQKSCYPQWSESAYRAVLDNFFLTSEQKISKLSRGERAGLSLALALAQKPQLLILDEPTLGLDVVAKQSFLESMLFVGEQEQCTVLYCSHNMEEVERIADTLVLMEQGQVKEVTSPEDFCERAEYWVAEFEGEPPAVNQIEHLLQVKKIDDMYHYMLLDCDRAFDAFLQANGATSTFRNPVSLDRAVNAYLTRSKHLQLMESRI